MGGSKGEGGWGCIYRFLPPCSHERGIPASPRLFTSHSTTPALFSNPLNLPENINARNIQSMNMPYHTPERPRSNMYTKRYANPIRNTHMENTDTAMVNFASREALRA